VTTTTTPIYHIQYQENGCIDRKPPIDTTKKTKSVVKMDPVLKIEEDLDDVVTVREISTQTSPIMSKLRNVHNTSSTLWTSEESIARGPENADEDNK
jgi:division protein CdvB (Snf7/Vps24/ESCRT-III family)